MALGILLMHGFTGSPADLEPLTERLRTRHGAAAVKVLALPGHLPGQEVPPAFDREGFRRTVLAAAGEFLAEGRKLVLVGHSTGGCVLLDALGALPSPPVLLVLLAVPRRADWEVLERWRHQREGAPTVPFLHSVQLASLINAMGARVHPEPSAVLVLQGEADELVPAAQAEGWRTAFSCASRTLLVSEAAHHLLRGPGSALALELAERAIQDQAFLEQPGPVADLAPWARLDSGLAAFLDYQPASAHHLAQSPQLNPGDLPERVPWEPLRAHIEVTTRCNLGCGHCARNWHPRAAQDMPMERFRRILDLLPHACPITLVGLGEPLLHPHLPEMVREAVARRRKVTVATNALALTGSLAGRLIGAGVDGFAFSLDTVTQDLAGQVRPGSRLDLILGNIRQVAALGPQVGKAVFAAVSTTTLPHLEALVETVATLGVQVLMLTDLNFRENLDQTLWRNETPALRQDLRRIIRKAFALGLPVLSVRGMEAIGLAARYRDFLLLSPDQLFRRSTTRTWCQSPWQTLPVAVDGMITLCDCQPGSPVGNLLDQPLAETWNGPLMKAHRVGMLGPEPPEACRICPRF
jgi:MoaA/NifB/PqqE/SkfB family radical SAM enzyme/esterase/lipase